MARPLLPPGGSLISTRAMKSLYLGRRVDRAALVWPALDGAVHDLVFVRRAGPAGEIRAVEHRFETGVFAVAGEDAVGLIGADFADEDVAPADFAAVGLEFDRAFGRDRRLAVVIVLQQRVIHHQLVVEPHAHSRADHDHPHRIPEAERIVRQHQRVFAGRAGAVVPKPARALVGAQRKLVLFGVIPNLHLGASAQIDARIGPGHRLVLHQQLEVAVILLGGGVGPLAVIDQLAVLDRPMALHLFSPLRDLRLPLLGRHGQELAMVEGSPPRQPWRSLPLNNAVNPGGGFADARGFRRGAPLKGRRPKTAGQKLLPRPGVSPGPNPKPGWGASKGKRCLCRKS